MSLFLDKLLYHDANFDTLTVNECSSTTRCQCNHFCIHSLAYEGEFQNSQNIIKYVLSQLSLLNLIS